MPLRRSLERRRTSSEDSGERFEWSASPDPTVAPFQVVDRGTGRREPVDFFSTEKAAAAAAGALNRGVAEIAPHRPVGCRVLPRVPGR